MGWDVVAWEGGMSSGEELSDLRAGEESARENKRAAVRVSLLLAFEGRHMH